MHVLLQCILTILVILEHDTCTASFQISASTRTKNRVPSSKQLSALAFAFAVQNDRKTTITAKATSSSNNNDDASEMSSASVMAASFTNSTAPLSTATTAKRKRKNTPGTKSNASNNTSSSLSTSTSTTTTKVLEPPYWVNPADPVVYNQTFIHCTIRGNPLPLRRHRTARGFMYNPSAKAQVSFQESIRTSLKLSSLPVYADSREDYDKDDNATTSSSSSSSSLIPLTHFGPDQAIRLHAMFYLARPKHHFRSSVPGVGRIKPTAPSRVQRQVDIDNLAKFVLDSLNGVLYADDHQVVSLHCTKCYDDDDVDDHHLNDDKPLSDDRSTAYCRGKTVLWLQSVSDHDMMAQFKSHYPPI